MNKVKKTIVLICSFATLCITLGASTKSIGTDKTILINEVCAKNTLYAASDGGYYDWIELYNASNYSVDLSGYGLSDDTSRPYRFTFPNGTSIASGQRLMVFCNSVSVSIDGQLAASFGLSTDGETITLSDSSGNQLDTVTFGTIGSNISYGRVPDGSDSLGYMEVTPNAPNKSASIISSEIASPEFSRSSGFYSDSFQLSISAAQGTAIYYTLDGSDPTVSSTHYTSSLSVSDISGTKNILSARTDIAPSSWTSSVTAPTSPVDKAVVIKAIAVDANGSSSDVTTGTYFVGYQNKDSYYQNMKVISIVTQSDNLFDYEKGIYVLGKVYNDWKNGPDYSSDTDEWMIPANYTQSGSEWERKATMQIFGNGSMALSQNVGIRIHGGATRSMTQKSLNIYARSEYGASKLGFDLFSGTVSNHYNGKAITEFDSFMLRSGGNDAQYTRFRDKLNQSLVSDRSFLTQGMEPCIVFIDGEYWGQYEITEKLSDDYIKSHYNISKKDICIIKNQELDTGDEETFTEYEQLREWITSTDFSESSNYNQLCSKVDMQGFIDYMSSEIYFNNWDWGSNNVAMWKSTVTDPSNSYADGRWRFAMFDTEYSTNLYGQTGASTDTFSQIMKTDSFISDLLNAAMKNDTFKKQFCLTFMDISNRNFDSAKISALITKLSNEYHDTTIDTYNRFWPEWPGGYMAETTLSREVDSVKSFYNSRFASITGSLKTACVLNGTLKRLTIKGDASCGEITLNTITPNMETGSWSGSYYTDYPVKLSAKPKAGYQFAYWQTSTGEKINSASTEIKLTANITVTAVYEKSQFVMGDINSDGSVNADDVLMLRKHLLNVSHLTAEQTKRANLCNDSSIDAFDLVILKRMLLDN